MRGFAHGFVTLEEGTAVQYKVDNLYHKESEGSIRYNDPELAINWRVQNALLSDKDAQAPFLRDCVNDINFLY